jgi:hypothetical protein
MLDMSAEALPFQSAVQKVNLLDERKKDRFIVSTLEGRSFVVSDIALTVLYGLTNGKTPNEIALELHEKDPAGQYSEKKIFALANDVLLPKGLIWKMPLTGSEGLIGSSKPVPVNGDAALREKSYVNSQ